MANQLKAILKALIELPTVSTDLESNTQAIDYIDHFLSERAMHVYRHEFNGRPALVATTQRTKTPKIMLAAHTDVVPAPPAMFTMTEKDGKIYGRGAYDMKCAIAAYLQLIDDIQDDLHQYDLGIMITCDEEVGGENGVIPLLELGYRAEACVLPDGGDNWQLEQSAKGLFWYRLTASGTAAHGSRPWDGISATDRILRTLQAIRQHMPTTQDPSTNTFNIGAIHGGEVFNQVADHCQADIDIRFTDAKQEHAIRQLVARICAEHDVTPRIMTWGPAFHVDLGNPYVVAWGRSFEKIVGQPLQTMRSLAGSDARWLAAAGITTIVTYPKGEGLHSDSEWVDVEAFYQLKDLIRDFVEQTGMVVYATNR